MSKIVTRDVVAEQAEIHVEIPSAARSDQAVHQTTDRTFELPKRLYVGTVAAYLGFLAVMALGLMNPELAIPMVIFALFIVAGFGVPTIWVKMLPENNSRSLSWGKFLNQGIQTHTGHMKAKDAVVQVLILPVLIFAWGVAIVAIRAFSG